MLTNIFVAIQLSLYAFAIGFLIYIIATFSIDLYSSYKETQNTTVHCAPKPVTDSPKTVIRYVTVNEYNVFNHITVPEECSQISTDSLHQDPAQLYRHGDTLEIGLRYYKN